MRKSGFGSLVGSFDELAAQYNLIIDLPTVNYPRRISSIIAGYMKPAGATVDFVAGRVIVVKGTYSNTKQGIDPQGISYPAGFPAVILDVCFEVPQIVIPLPENGLMLSAADDYSVILTAPKTTAGGWPVFDRANGFLNVIGTPIGQADIMPRVR